MTIPERIRIAADTAYQLGTHEAIIQAILGFVPCDTCRHRGQANGATPCNRCICFDRMEAEELAT